jgi:hypothetical protein
MDEMEIGTEKNLSPFITTANVLINSVCLLSGYTDELLTVIEMWLSAHFVRINFAEVQKEVMGRAQTEFLMKNDLNLAQTRYGQQAMVLDFKGNLASISKANDPTKTGRPMRAFWGGTENRTNPDGCCDRSYDY